MLRCVIGNGVWPVMLTPFTTRCSIDWAGVDALTDWYIDAGVAGLFAVAQSSEMYALDQDERLALATRVVKRAAGRVPVVACGTFGGSIARQSGSIRKMADTGVQAVVVITSQLARPGDGDDMWRGAAEQVLDLTEGIPLGLYECPAPYKRLLSPQMMRWAAQTGRFVFHKDTSLSMHDITEKIAAVTNTSLRFFNAEASSLYDSLAAGGHGYCGIAANFYPQLLVWLCRHHKDDPEKAWRLQRFFSVAEFAVDYKYPTSAKYFLRAIGAADILPVCRVHNVEISEHDQRGLMHLSEWIAALHI